MSHRPPTHRERLVAIYERELQLHHDAQSAAQRACVSLATMPDARDVDVISGISCAAHFFDKCVKQATRVAALQATLHHLGFAFDSDTGDIIERAAARAAPSSATET